MNGQDCIFGTEPRETAVFYDHYYYYIFIIINYTEITESVVRLSKLINKHYIWNS